MVLKIRKTLIPLATLATDMRPKALMGETNMLVKRAFASISIVTVRIGTLNSRRVVMLIANMLIQIVLPLEGLVAPRVRTRNSLRLVKVVYVGKML